MDLGIEREWDLRDGKIGLWECDPLLVVSKSEKEVRKQREKREIHETRQSATT